MLLSVGEKQFIESERQFQVKLLIKAHRTSSPTTRWSVACYHHLCHLYRSRHCPPELSHIAVSDSLTAYLCNHVYMYLTIVAVDFLSCYQSV